MAQNYSAQTSINIKASADKVWQALVDPSIVKKYLHGTTMNANWKEGGLITYKGQWKGQEYEDKGTVLKFEPKNCYVQLIGVRCQAQKTNKKTIMY